MANLHEQLLSAYCQSNPLQKCRAVALLPDVPDASLIGRLSADPLPLQPGRPIEPRLIHPRDVPRRGLGSIAGRAALIHAVAHIEFNAINLALDACLRFAGLPAAYYADWISVAKDEARHFGLLLQRLGELGSDYGALPAHNGLWEAAGKTAQDVLARMALVPRVLEARGLDVTPGMIARLKEVGDTATAAALSIILDEEVRHVAIGTHWFRLICEQRGLPADETFRTLLRDHDVRVRPPLNWPARQAAGFRLSELPLEIPS